MIRFPLTDLLNQQECYNFLLDILHSQGLCCPYGHFLPAGQCPHMGDRAPVLDYRCRECGPCFMSLRVPSGPVPTTPVQRSF